MNQGNKARQLGMLLPINASKGGGAPKSGDRPTPPPEDARSELLRQLEKTGLAERVVGKK